MKRFFTFENIYKIIVIIAIGYLIFSILSVFNVSSKRFDKIDQNQEKIMQDAASIIKNHNKEMQRADSIDNLRILEIQKLTTELSSVKSQLKSVEKEISSYKKVFDQNKVELPNPWQEK